MNRQMKGAQGRIHGHLFQKSWNLISGGRGIVGGTVWYISSPSDHSCFLITEGEEGHHFIVFVLHHCKNRE